MPGSASDLGHRAFRQKAHHVFGAAQLGRIGGDGGRGGSRSQRQRLGIRLTAGQRQDKGCDKTVARANGGPDPHLGGPGEQPLIGIGVLVGCIGIAQLIALRMEPPGAGGQG